MLNSRHRVAEPLVTVRRVKKGHLRSLFTALPLAVPGPAVAAADGPAALPAPAVAQAVVLAREAALARAPQGATVQVSALPADPRLRLAPCARAEARPVPGAPAWGRTRVALRCAEGAAWTVYLPLQVDVRAPALVARAALAAGTSLAPAQVEVAMADWSAAGSLPLAPGIDVAGRTLARPLAAGQVLRSGDLQPRQWFASGDAVRVHAVGAGWSIVTEGQALNAGIEGQPVRVRTGNGRVLTGRASGADRVEVTL